jgi:hypothetical protein
MMTNIKITVFWDVMTHSLINVYWVNEKHQSQIQWLLEELESYSCSVQMIDYLHAFSFFV